MNARRMLARLAAVTLGGAAVVPFSIAPGAVARAEEPDIARTYTGNIVSGTGAYRWAAGALSVNMTMRLVRAVSLPFLGGSEYAATITLRGRPCRARVPAPAHRTCLPISGTVAGMAILEPHIGDRPIAARLASLAGRIAPLGAVTATGRIEGTGFVAVGRRSLYVTISSADGTVSLGALGPQVRGFQSP